ncbi:MAG: DNA polymerase III subunit alpha, partial [Planctomycetes bacterium]|nr:DNA polymerase III subunit alpha [Planctomycetota bacterium]
MKKVTFQVLEGVDKGRVFRELQIPITIGREEGNLLRLNDERISRFHAKIQQEDEDVILTDLESTNGTRVNGSPVQIRRLRPGDQISLGRSMLLFGTLEEIAARRTSTDRPTARSSKIVDPGAIPVTAPGDDLHFDLNTMNAGSMSLDHGWGTSDGEMPPLPLKLSPAQAARLAEIFDFLHRGITCAVENIEATEDGGIVRLGFNEWQTIQAVQLFLARYTRAVADPDAPGHCHTHYSLLDGANRIPELVEQTKKQGMNAIAITDHGNLFGAIEFHRECKAAGLNPIIGYEAYLAPGSRFDKTPAKRGDAYSHLTLLAKNFKGFQNLIKMSSYAFTEGFYHAPRIDRELLEAHSEGLICLSGCLSGEFNDWILKGDVQKAENLAGWFSKLFKKDYYIELQNNGLDIQDQCTVEAVRIAAKMGLPLVATADAHYLCASDAVAHDVLVCINTGKKRSDPNRMRYGDGCRFPNPFYVRSPEDMYKLFPDQADAVQRSQEIADSVDIDIDFKKRHFPVFTPPRKKTPEEYLRELCLEGVKERYGKKPAPEVMARVEHELGVICKMGFASYFLIVWDFVRFARESGIPCSARGSGCGAVVSYVLYLSHVDPLKYDLLFERFLDPNRGEAPDIDIDFCQERRELVIDYVKQKYGEQSVAQIATFGTMAAKAAIKDVGRVLDIPLEKVNLLTKWVSAKLGTSIDDTIRDSPDFRREYESDPTVREWIDIARKLEGTNRNAGTHAAGVVIANGPITDYVPIQIVKRKDDASGEKREALTTQWVMGDLEKVGMLKMDFLGLRTLTLVDNAIKQIKKTRNIDVDVFKLPLDDEPTFKLLQRGDAKGVFQFESEGIRELLKRMKPDHIRDIIACTALYRPGPLEGGMVDEYIDCKHGRKKPTYPHPIMEEVLSETYGVMVYQEQVMRILNR